MNFFDSILSAEFIRAFAWTLFHSVWQGGLIALMAVALLIILRKHHPGTRYMVLYVLLTLLPVAFTVTFLYTYHPAAANIQGIEDASTSWVVQTSSIQNEMQAFTGENAFGAWYVNLVHVFENQAGWLVLLWFTGFSFFLLRFSGSLLYVYRLKHYQVFPVEEYWNDKMVTLSGRIGLQKPVRLAESAIARIPLTIGYLKPVILLPLGTLSGVPPQQIDAILLHEMAHILRKDYLLNIFQSVVELLFFYHPVAWWLSGMIRQEREHICDDLAIGVNHDHLNYIKALTTMEELNLKSPLLATAMGGSKKKLLFRVKRLLTPVKSRKGLSEGLIAFILLVGLVFVLSFNALSIIPTTYDLTGRESGDRLYNFLPLQTSAIPGSNTPSDLNLNEPVIPSISETPDTMTAKSKSGKVTIRVYTDTISMDQQEALDRMAESMDRQAQDHDKAMKDYQIEVEKFKDDMDQMHKERKVIVIRNSDSAAANGDSVIVIYKGSGTPFHGEHFEFEVPEPFCPLPPNAHEYSYFYSHPDLPELDQIRKQVYAFKNDSIDTLIFIEPEEHQLWIESQEFDKSARQIEKQVKELEMQNEFFNKQFEEPDVIVHPPVPPGTPQWNEINPDNRVASAERIIRQELRDDGLTVRHNKYIIDLDEHGMYINGEKQPKEVFKKYKRLVESLEAVNLEGGEHYRLIF